MDNGNIVLVKLFNGEMVIGEKSESDNSIFNLVLKNPRQIAILPTVGGRSANVVMGSICAPFKVKRLSEELTLPIAQVMFQIEEQEIDKELINGYKSEISGIQIASAADAAMIDSGNPGAEGFSI